MDEVIRQYLISDVLSRTALDVLDAVSEFEDEEQFDFLDDASKVPKHCYLSLSKLIFGADNKTSDLSSFVTAVPGTGNPEQSGIELMYASEEANEVPGLNPPDGPAGAEYALLKIITRVKEVSDDGSEDRLIRQIDARIRFLIDFKARALRTEDGLRLTGELDPSGIDNMLDPEYGVTCHWLKMLTPSNVLEKVSLYRVEFCTLMTP